MVRAWAFAFAGAFGISTAAVVAVNPGGVVTNAVDTVQQQIQNVTHTGGSTGGTPSIGACRPH